MRIDTHNRTTGVGKTGASGRAGARPDFVPAGTDGPSRTAGTTPVAGTAGIDAILALQAVGGPLEGKKKALRRGRSLLDGLDEIKADLLVGHVSAERLDALSALLAEVRDPADPALDAVLDDIDLRVRVELAKLGRYPGA